MAPRLAALLLAAGASRRMGTCKQLLPVGDQPAITHCLTTILAAGVQEVVVVIGANGDAVAAAVGHLPVRIVRNRDAAGDMADSVRTGLAALDWENSGVMICLADQPLVGRGTFQQLLRLHAACPDEILIPVFAGKRGHPTIFPRRLLQQFRPGMTLRDVVQGNPRQVRLIDIPDPWVTLDMDTPADYQTLLERFAAAGSNAGSEVSAWDTDGRCGGATRGNQG